MKFTWHTITIGHKNWWLGVSFPKKRENKRNLNGKKNIELVHSREQ